jgi:hypothetical protein
MSPGTQALTFLGILVAIGGLVLYWYGYRPITAHNLCEQQAKADVIAWMKSQPSPAWTGQEIFLRSDLEDAYRRCLEAKRTASR